MQAVPAACGGAVQNKSVQSFCSLSGSALRDVHCASYRRFACGDAARPQLFSLSGTARRGEISASRAGNVWRCRLRMKEYVPPLPGADVHGDVPCLHNHKALSHRTFNAQDLGRAPLRYRWALPTGPTRAHGPRAIPREDVAAWGGCLVAPAGHRGSGPEMANTSTF